MTPPLGSVPPVSNGFRQELSDIVSRLGRCLREMVSASPQNIRHGADLRRALDLDRRLSTQIHRVAFAEEPTEVAIHIPGQRSMMRFLEAAHRDTGMQRYIPAASALYHDFIAFVERAAGDRPTFDAMASTLSASEQEIESLNLQHRRAAFRAMSHFLGSQVKTFYRCSIFYPHPADSSGVSRADYAHVQFFHQVHRLNPEARLTLFQSSMGRLSGAVLKTASQREPINPALPQHGGANLFPEYSSDPLPLVRGTSLSSTSHRMEILRTEVGRQASVDIAFGYVDRSFLTSGPDGSGFTLGIASSLDTFCPTERIVADILIPETMMRGRELSVRTYANLFEMQIADVADWVTLHMNVEPEVRPWDFDSFGSEPDSHSNYGALVRTALKTLGWADARFVNCRMEVEFPLLHSRTLFQIGPFPA